MRIWVIREDNSALFPFKVLLLKVFMSLINNNLLICIFTKWYIVKMGSMACMFSTLKHSPPPTTLPLGGDDYWHNIGIMMSKKIASEDSVSQ